MSDFDADYLRKKTQQAEEKAQQVKERGFPSTEVDQRFNDLIETVVKAARQNAEKGKNYVEVTCSLHKIPEIYHDKIVKKTIAHFLSRGFSRVNAHLDQVSDSYLHVRLDW